MARPSNTREKIESNIDKSAGPDSCWIWKGHTDKDGYPLATMNYITYGVHRLMLSWYKGEHAGWALHSCDNPTCCNPNHLRWGTSKDNSSDREIRQRGNQGRTKFNDEGRNIQSIKVSKQFKFIDPLGKVFEGSNVKQFCVDHSLSYNGIGGLCRTGISYRGWTGGYKNE